MGRFTVLVATCLFGYATALLEAEPPLPSWWIKGERASPDRVIDISISLKAPEIDHAVIEDLSFPDSPNYGKWLDRQTVRNQTAPSMETYLTVLGWAIHHGMVIRDEFNKRVASNYSKNHGLPPQLWRLETTVANAEAVFQTRFHVVSEVEGDRQVLRAGDYTIPSEIEEYVSAIYGFHGLPLPSWARGVLKSSAKEMKVTPPVLVSTYKISGVTPSGSLKAKQAVGEFQDEISSEKDQKKFFEQWFTGDVAKEYKLNAVHGSDRGREGTAEASLDVQYIMGTAPGVKTDFWGIQNDDFCRDMRELTHFLQLGDDPPLVISLSYGWQGDLASIGCKERQYLDVDVQFKNLAAQGMTLVISSGDSGAGESPMSGSQALKNKLWPSWPASSPYVTAVGGTKFIKDESANGERATEEFGSGGGFSSMFNRTLAKWQESFVQNYFKIAPGLPPTRDYAANGRGTPDVSALAEGYHVIINGDTEIVGGTSASAPVFAGMVALINDARLAAGKSSMGLINPFLYANADAFTDVTVGSNKIDRGGDPTKLGWNCTKSWDPVTGLGTPVFSTLLARAMKA